MKKSIKLFVACLLILSMLCGCGREFPELTEQQNATVTNYAAQLLLKYDRSYDSRIVDLTKVDEKEPEIQIIPDTDLPQESDDKEEPVEKDPDYIDTDDTIVDGKPVQMTMEEILKLENVDIECLSYSIQDEYPEDGTVVMSADEGKKLVVFYFLLTNTATESQDIDIRSEYTRFRFYINASKQLNTLATVFEDDLANFNQTAGAGESVLLTLTVQVTEEFAELEFTNIELLIKVDDDSTLVTLQ